MVRVRMLGGAAVLRDGAPLDSVNGQRKLIALLALLAAAGRRGISRDRIVSLLWPESDTERARGSLKQSLHVLRRGLGAADFVTGTVELRLNGERVASDLDEFQAALAAGDPARAIDRYGGPFLDGFHLGGAVEFEQWVDEQRAALARLHADALESVARAAHQKGDLTAAAALWRRLQAADPFSARAVVGVMESLAASGERGAALQAGQAYESRMREELGIAPDPRVLSLIERMREPPPSAPGHVPARGAGSVGAKPASAPQHPPTTPTHAIRPEPACNAPSRVPRRWTVRAAALLTVAALLLLAVRQFTRDGDATTADRAAASVAVIPFVNTSDNAADGHFADGLTDELISTLGRVDGMRVSARTSTFALKDRGLSARAFAETLGVATVIEGTVRRQGDRLKVTAQLVDPADNSVLWSESFDREVQDMIALQEEIATAIVRVLQRQRPAGAPAPPARASVDPEAYDLYLRGRYGWDLPLRERLQQAARYHQRAVERDPSFAPAYAALAETYVNLAIYGHMPAAEALARANVAAERALALDAGLAEALVARAYVRLSGLQFAGAAEDLRRAVAANPNYSWAHHFFSLYLLMTDRPQAAARYNRQALVLDPLSLPANATRGVIQAQLGNNAAAERELERALQLRSDFMLTLYYLGVVRVARGSDAAALVALQEAAGQAPDYPGLPGALVVTLRRLGRSGEADAIMADLERRSAGDPRARLNLAFAHGALGQTDTAMALLRDARWDVPALIGLRSDPLLAGLRADPRLGRLLQDIGAEGNHPD